MHAFRRLQKVVLVASAALGIVVSAVGCGPIEYVNQVTRKASSEVEAAKSVKADKYSPYFYTLAVEYLHKAREEAAHADYQSANRFGRRSEEAAIKAREIALKRASDPDSLPSIPEEESKASDTTDDFEIVDPTSEEAIEDKDDDPFAIDTEGL